MTLAIIGGLYAAVAALAWYGFATRTPMTPARALLEALIWPYLLLRNLTWGRA